MNRTASILVVFFMPMLSVISNTKTLPTKKEVRIGSSYIEPHRIIINDIAFIVFNYSNEIFIENLSNNMELSELEDYLKTI